MPPRGKSEGCGFCAYYDANPKVHCGPVAVTCDFVPSIGFAENPGPSIISLTTLKAMRNRMRFELRRQRFEDHRTEFVALAHFLSDVCRQANNGDTASLPFWFHPCQDPILLKFEIQPLTLGYMCLPEEELRKVYLRPRRFDPCCTCCYCNPLACSRNNCHCRSRRTIL